jgi:hypothetical protein
MVANIAKFLNALLKIEICADEIGVFYSVFVERQSE